MTDQENMVLQRLNAAIHNQSIAEAIALIDEHQQLLADPNSEFSKAIGIIFATAIESGLLALVEKFQTIFSLYRGAPYFLDIDGNKELPLSLAAKCKNKNRLAIFKLLDDGSILFEKSAERFRDENNDLNRCRIISPAIECGHEDVIEYILSKDTSPSLYSEYSHYLKESLQETAVSFAFRKGRPEIALLFLEKGVDPYEVLITLLDNKKYFNNNSYDSRESLKLCFDYLMGTDLKKYYFESTDRFFKKYLANTDITGFSFIGLTFQGIPVTQEHLRSANSLNCENAIYRLNDLQLTAPELISDQELKRRRRLLERFTQLAAARAGLDDANNIPYIGTLSSLVLQSDISQIQSRLEHSRIDFKDTNDLDDYRKAITLCIESNKPDHNEIANTLIKKAKQISPEIFLKKLWLDLIIIAIETNNGLTLNYCLDAADQTSISELLYKKTTGLTIPLARKILDRGFNLDLPVSNTSLYSILLEPNSLKVLTKENKKELIQNTMVMMCFLKHEALLTPSPAAVLNDLSTIAENFGDQGLDLFSIIFQFPHDNHGIVSHNNLVNGTSSMTISLPCFFHLAQNMISYPKEKECLQLLRFLHNHKIPLDSIENEKQQNLLHLHLNSSNFYYNIDNKNRMTYFYEMVRFLIQVGVNPDKKDQLGNSPIDYANVEIKDELEKIISETEKKIDVIFDITLIPFPPVPPRTIVNAYNAQQQNSGVASSIYSSFMGKVASLK